MEGMMSKKLHQTELSKRDSIVIKVEADAIRNALKDKLDW